MGQRHIGTTGASMKYINITRWASYLAKGRFLRCAAMYRIGDDISACGLVSCCVYPAIYSKMCRTSFLERTPTVLVFPTHLQVYAAMHRKSGKEVALKIIFLGKPDLSEASVNVLRSEEALMRRIDHPNIANIFDRVLLLPKHAADPFVLRRCFCAAHYMIAPALLCSRAHIHVLSAWHYAGPAVTIGGSAIALQ
jgi:hypothetical protein